MNSKVALHWAFDRRVIRSADGRGPLEYVQMKLHDGRRYFTGLGLCLLVLGQHAHARAHAGPQVSDMLFSPKDQTPVLISNRGLIFGSGGPKDWSLMCNEAVGVSTSEVPPMVDFADGRIMAATTNGLLVTSDSGCSWQGVDPYGMQSTPSIAQSPSDPQRLYIATYGPGMSALRTSGDAGKTWDSILPASDSTYLQYIRIAPSMAERIYARSLDFGGDGGFHYQVLRSDDAGKSWQRYDIAVSDSETDLVLLGVSPFNPDEVIAMAQAADPIGDKERLLVSHDAGKTFANVGMFSVITQVLWSSDKQSIYVASDEGLLKSTDDGATFARVGVAEYLSCVIEHDDVILTCGYYKSIPEGSIGIGMSSDGGETFTEYMDLNNVRMPLSCPASAPTASTCAPLWVDWQREILGAIPGVTDAGPLPGYPTMIGRDASVVANDGGTASDAGASVSGGSGGHAGAAGANVGSESDAGVPPKKLAASSCGCELAGTGESSTRATVWLVAALCLVAFRRRRRLRRFASLGGSN
ncbi:MAG TPA: hypothetical protein VGI70_04830 [Polyangiales bacterium]|jgi:photosystem II stability/assembly factor-like uncharacterized protein